MSTVINPLGTHPYPEEHILEMCGLVRIWMNGIQQATVDKGGQKYDIRVALDMMYAHGGGWNPALPGMWDLTDEMILTYLDSNPDESEAYTPLMTWEFNNGQRAAMYECQWVVVETPDHGFEVVRMD